RLGEQETTYKVDVDDVAERLGCDLFEGLRALSADASRHINEDIDGPGGLYQQIDRRWIGNVNLVRFGDTPAAVGTNEVEHLIDQQIGGKHASAASCKGAHDGMADTAGGTNNQYALAPEFDQHAASAEIRMRRFSQRQDHQQ